MTSNLQTLDLSRYLSEISVSVHVGSLHMAPSGTDAADSPSVPERVNRGLTLSESPSVCVLIPVHNGEPYLAQCLHSLLTRTQNCSFEVLVVDDGSTDSSAHIAETVRVEAENGVFSNNPGAVTALCAECSLGLPSITTMRPDYLLHDVCRRHSEGVATRTCWTACCT